MALSRPGVRSARRTTMIVTTTRSSMRVKAGERAREGRERRKDSGGFDSIDQLYHAEPDLSGRPIGTGRILLLNLDQQAAGAGLVVVGQGGEADGFPGLEEAGLAVGESSDAVVGVGVVVLGG